MRPVNIRHKISQTGSRKTSKFEQMEAFFRLTSNFFSSSLATVYRTSAEFGLAAVHSAVFSQSSNRE